MNHKIVEFSQIDTIRKETLHKKMVLVGGCFDIYHYGHHTFLTAAKKEGDILIVALESDEFIKKRKKKVPIHTQQQRAELLAATHMVDYVLKLPYFTSHGQYFDMVKAIKPAIIAVTVGDSKLPKKKEQADSIGAVVCEVTPQLESFSSSKIVTYESIFSD